PQLQRIKAEFDPYNQLNRGKIATPAADIELLKIDGVTTRGQEDRKIPVQVWNAYSEGIHCTGNGLRYNRNPTAATCRSRKGAREGSPSPNGRVSSMREWLKPMSERGVKPAAASAAIKRSNFLLTLPARIKNTWQKRQ